MDVNGNFHSPAVLPSGKERTELKLSLFRAVRQGMLADGSLNYYQHRLRNISGERQHQLHPGGDQHSHTVPPTVGLDIKFLVCPSNAQCTIHTYNRSEQNMQPQYR